MCSRPPALDATDFSTRREWRRMDAMARQCLAAVRLAIDDAGASDLVGSDDVALIVGTQTGGYDTAAEFHAGARRGIRHINPALFANAALSSTAGHICSALSWHGPTATLSSGWTSALNALMCGYRMVRAGRVRASVVVACDVLCAEAIDDLLALDALSSGAVTPYDRLASGAGIGSAAVAILIEPSDASLSAKRHPYARIAGGAAVGEDVRQGGLPTESVDWMRCLQRALSVENIDAGAIDLVVGAANGVAEIDMAEAKAMAMMLPHAPFVTAPKALVGECRGADGLIGLVAGLYSARHSSIPPSPGLIEPIASDILRFARPDRCLPAQIGMFAVTAASPGGNHAAVVVDAS